MSRILTIVIAIAAVFFASAAFYLQFFLGAPPNAQTSLVAFRLSSFLGIWLLSVGFICLPLGRLRPGSWLLGIALLLSSIAAVDAISRVAPPERTELQVLPEHNSSPASDSTSVTSNGVVIGTFILSCGALLSMLPIPGAIALSFIIGAATLTLAMALSALMPVATAALASGTLALPYQGASPPNTAHLSLWATLGLLSLGAAFWSYARPDISVARKVVFLSSSWLLWVTGLVSLAAGLILIAPHIVLQNSELVNLPNSISVPGPFAEPPNLADTEMRAGEDLERPQVLPRGLQIEGRRTNFGGRLFGPPYKQENPHLKGIMELAPLLGSVLLLSFVAFSGVHAFALRSYVGLNVLRRVAIQQQNEFHSALKQSELVEAELEQVAHNRNVEKQRAFSERNALLKEIHHRVKNNLQIILSFLNLQLRGTQSAEAQAALQESRGRVRSIALIHEILYRTGDFSNINMLDYIEQLCDEQRAVQQSKGSIDFSVTGTPVTLHLDQAIPCGLALNELVSGILKRFPPTTEPQVLRIELAQRDDRFVFAIDGPGIASIYSEGPSESLELRFAKALVAQFDGSLGINPEKPSQLQITGTIPSQVAV